jgi:hypothetical protein
MPEIRQQPRLPIVSSPDLRSVDELCRLGQTLRKLGCGIHLVDIDPELKELLELAGVADVLGECPAAAPSPDSNPTDGALR